MLPAHDAATGTARGRRALARLGARLERPAPGDARLANVAMSAVLVVAGALFLFRLGAAEICSSNEAVEGLVVQQMVEHDQLLAPLLNGRQPMFKPPLFHWTATAIARGLGMHEVTELTVRLPSVGFALGSVLLTMLFVRRWLGLTNGLLSGLVLVAAYQFFVEARFGRVDMALTCCEALALFTLVDWTARPDAGDPPAPTRFADRRLYVGAAALGLGVLAKGPVGAILPLTAVVGVLVTERRWRDLRALASPGPLLTLVAVGSSWYLACLWTGHLDVLHRQILDENLSRFSGGIRTMSPFYYLKPLLLNSVPLSLLVPVAVVEAWRAHRAERTSTAPGDLRPYALAVFWMLTLLFFSVAAYKRRAYLLPLWPPAAALLVWRLNAWRDERRRRLARAWLVVGCGVLAIFNVGFAPFAERAECARARYRDAAAAINGTVPRRAALYFDDATTESASLLFYLDRPVPVLDPAAHPDGYVLMPERTWEAHPAGDLRRLLDVQLERRRLVLAGSTGACDLPAAPTP
ncbi:MAG TPA: phospholipid carrier-dependent glycosyltransferase [Candidatus Binatia bacterium]|jgi:4-amino-4-deoxy-L-arabinose transferase-like glycosyltransferase